MTALAKATRLGKVLFLRAAGGALLLYLGGQAARFTFGGCTSLCDPWVSVPLGSIIGVVVFSMVASDER